MLRVAHLAQFPAWRYNHMRWADFRRDAWSSLGIIVPHTQRVDEEEEAPAGGGVPTFLWVLAANGSNGRRIWREAALIDAVQAVVRRERPTWRFRVLTVGRGVAAYREE